jgi:hypothetical protein
MSAKLFDHAQTKDTLSSGMVKNVKPNQAGVKFLVESGRASHYPNPLSQFDNIKPPQPITEDISNSGQAAGSNAYTFQYQIPGEATGHGPSVSRAPRRAG